MTFKEITQSFGDTNINSLVSIIVITYNSAAFVLDTLESIKAQTYQNVELIISDDCSVDETVILCERWLLENRGRFVRAGIITVENNTGIPSNCNRGVQRAEGIWVKLIAGDDFLDENYINECVNKAESEERVGIVYTNTSYVNEFNKSIGNALTKNYKSGFVFEEIFFLKFWPKAPSMMFLKEAIVEAGFFDTSIWVEDYLLVMKIAQKYKMVHLDKYLTFYRIHDKNVGSASIKLCNAQLEAIKFFKNYKGYYKRKKQICRDIFVLALFEKPSTVPTLIIKDPLIIFDVNVVKKLISKAVRFLGFKKSLS